MLHIILGILKMLGILLAVLLLLIILAVFAVLLVPVRYRVRIVKMDAELGGQIKLNWLLRILSVTLSYDLTVREPQILIRIFGISLESIRKGFGRLSNWILKLKDSRHRLQDRKKSEKEMKRIRECSDSITSAEDALEKESDRFISDTDENNSTENPEEDEVPEDLDQDIENETIKNTEQNVNLEYREHLEDSNAEESTEENIEESTEEDIPLYRKVLYSLAGFCDKIKGIPEKLKNVISKVIGFIKKLTEKIKSVFSSVQNLKEKIEQIPTKIEEFLQFLEDYAVKQVFGDVMTELLYILKHYGPRKAEGFVHFGTGDPAKTGQMTGILYMILPVQAGKLEIQPEFSESLLETELLLKGHVRTVHLIPVAWRLLRNKKLIRLIKKIKSRRKG